MKPIIERKGLAERLDAAFLEPAPPIETVYNLGHADLGGEQQFFCFTAHKLRCSDPTAFFARAVALTWEDATVGEDGAPFPGLRQLARADLSTPGYLEQREDMLSGEWTDETADRDFQALCGKVELSKLRSLRPVLRIQQTVSKWNCLRFIWETDSHWVFAEWSTSA